MWEVVYVWDFFFSPKINNNKIKYKLSKLIKKTNISPIKIEKAVNARVEAYLEIIENFFDHVSDVIIAGILKFTMKILTKNNVVQKDVVLPWLAAIKAYRLESPRSQWLDNWLLSDRQMRRIREWAKEKQGVEIAANIRYVFSPTVLNVLVCS